METHSLLRTWIFRHFWYGSPSFAWSVRRAGGLSPVIVWWPIRRKIYILLKTHVLWQTGRDRLLGGVGYYGRHFRSTQLQGRKQLLTHTSLPAGRVVETLAAMRHPRSAIFALLVTCTLSFPVPRQDRQVPYEDPQVSLSLWNTTDLRKLSPEAKEAVVKVRIWYNT
jgi:hypothetical protein